MKELTMNEKKTLLAEVNKLSLQELSPGIKIYYESLLNYRNDECYKFI